MVIELAEWTCSCRSFWGNSVKDPSDSLKLRTKVEYSFVMQEFRIFSHSFPCYWLLDFNFNGINFELINAKTDHVPMLLEECSAGKH
jgi:hypothetical protein